MTETHLSPVMPGFMPGIHVLSERIEQIPPLRVVARGSAAPSTHAASA